MIAIPAVIGVPLRVDEGGAIRVGQTRVLLEVIVVSYQKGNTPEEIHRDFPTVALADVYAVIAYYLANREVVDEYIRQVELAGEEIRRKFEALPSYRPLTREMLLARLKEKQRKQD